MLDNKSQEKKRIASNTMYLYLRMLLIMAVQIYTSRVILEALGVVDYGLYNVVGGMVAMFGFLNMALSQATQRFIAFGIKRDPEIQQQNTFSMLLNVHILLSLFVILMCEIIGTWLLFNRIVIPQDRIVSAFWVMQCSLFSLVITITQVPYNAAIYGHEKMNAYAYISIIEAGGKLLSVMSLKFFFTDKLLTYGIMQLCLSFIIAFIYRIYCRRSFSICKYKITWSGRLFRQIYEFTSWSIIGNLAWAMNNQGINILINIFFGPIMNAARGIAVAVETAVSSFLYNFTGASIPAIIKAYSTGEVDYMKQLNAKSSKLGFLLFMCISLPIISIIDKILHIWLETPPEQSSILCVLSLIYIQCNSLSGTLQNVVQATGDVKSFQLTNGILKLSALPIIYVIYSFNFPLTSYLYVLIIISVLGLFVQLQIVSKKIVDFSIYNYLYYVTKPQICSYVVPLFLALFLSSKEYNLLPSFIIFFFMIIVCVSFSWFIGLTSPEKKWILSVAKERYRKFVKSK